MKNKKYNSPRRDFQPAFCIVDTTDHKGRSETRCMVQARQAEDFMAKNEAGMSVGPAPLHRDSQGYLQSDDMVPLHILNQARGIRPTYVVNGKTINPPHYVYVNQKFMDYFTEWLDGHQSRREETQARRMGARARKSDNMVSMDSAWHARERGLA